MAHIKDLPRQNRCTPRRPEFPIERTTTAIDGLWIYGWPSEGGLVVLSHPTRVDFEYLGWEILDPPRKRDKNQDAEDEVCQMLLHLGGTWYDCRSGYNLLIAVARNATSARNQIFDKEVPPATTTETLWIRVGWPSTGGLWVARYFDYTFEDVVDGSVEWNGQDYDYGIAAGQIVLAKDMDERCEISKRLGGKFYASLDDYQGNGCLKAWEQRLLVMLGRLFIRDMLSGRRVAFPFDPELGCSKNEGHGR